MTLEGKVAAILNERELVVNLGSEVGVVEGMKFKVVEPSRQILDPDTGETLGTFEREKVRVRILEVNPKYSVGSTYETYKVTVGGGGIPDFSYFFGRSREVTRIRTLRPDGGLYLEPMDETKSFVKIGDPVVLVEDGL